MLSGYMVKCNAHAIYASKVAHCLERQQKEPTWPQWQSKYWQCFRLTDISHSVCAAIVVLGNMSHTSSMLFFCVVLLLLSFISAELCTVHNTTLNALCRHCQSVGCFMCGDCHCWYKPLWIKASAKSHLKNHCKTKLNVLSNFLSEWSYI